MSIFIDEPDWAFYNIARNLARIAPEGTQFIPILHADWFGRTAVAEAVLAESDIALFLWRFDLLALLDTLSERGWDLLLRPNRPALATMIYDHVYMRAEDLMAYGDPFALSDAVAASSDRLRAEYASAAHLPTPSHVLADGVDTMRFAPGPPRRPGPVRIGWVGNSAWGATVGADFKGRYTILDPALDILSSRGFRFERRIADKAERRVPVDEMPGFYHNIDILVCASSVEGTPNPVLEAMASGCAIVSTDVGIVRDVLGPAQRAFILAERSPGALADRLAELIAKPDLLARLKAENLARRPHLAWESRWPEWQAFLDTALAARPGLRGAQVRARLIERRARRRTPIERLRRTVAGNRIAFMAYRSALRRCPGALRWAKRLMTRGIT